MGWSAAVWGVNRRYLKVSIRSLFVVAWWQECELALESAQCCHVITFCGRTVTRTRNCIDIAITSLCNNFFGFQVMRIQHCLDVASKSPCDNFLWSHDNENSTKSKPWCNHFLWLHGLWECDVASTSPEGRHAITFRGCTIKRILRCIETLMQSLFVAARLWECDVASTSPQGRHVVTFCGRTVMRMRLCINWTAGQKGWSCLFRH